MSAEQTISTINALIDSNASTLLAINADARTANRALVDAYKRVVQFIDANRTAFVDEVNKLVRGTADGIVRVADELDPSTVSSAWHAFCVDPEAFNDATAVRRFAEIVRESKGPDASQSAPLSRALKQLTSALDKAVRAGAKPETIADLVRAAFPRKPQTDQKPQESPQTEQKTEKPQQKVKAAA